MTLTPEPPHRQELRDIAATVDRQIAKLDAVLTLHDASGQKNAVPLTATWQPLAGRPGVQIYHVPNPAGTADLFLTAFAVTPGSEYVGGQLDESQLVGLLAGALECNGQHYQPGQFLWLAPNESTNWRTEDGAFGVVLYNSPLPASLKS